MATLRLVLGDQLSRSLSSLKDLEPAADIVLLAEVWDEATYVRHHVKKIAFLFSAMRHFASQLEASGVTVDYVKIDAHGNKGSLKAEVARALKTHGCGRVVVTEPGEYRLYQDMKTWASVLNVPVEIRDDDRFICAHETFRTWAAGRKSLRMEYFYRDMRRQTGLLMNEGGEPEGGQWNFDAENRQSLPADVSPPERLKIKPDAVTKEVLEVVGRRFGDHFGDLEPFWFAVTSEDASAALDHFLEECLPRFGDYQDAMRAGAPFLYHGLIGLYLNAGLLNPIETCRRAELAYVQGDAPLNAVEGFIRQIIGWREFIRGIYWLKMPEYKETNALNATRPLPDFYWTGKTDMACLADVIGQTREHAYAHHIQRLMVTGNFALLAGLDPVEVNEWYLIVYADAYEWVELPNTHGMALFADGGVLASKPYAASGQYINRMSDYCKGCRYSVSKKNGPKACPFNYLYWNFLIENRETLSGNPRLGMPYRTLAKMSDDKVAAIREDSRRFFKSIEREGAAPGGDTLCVTKS